MCQAAISGMDSYSSVSFIWEDMVVISEGSLKLKLSMTSALDEGSAVYAGADEKEVDFYIKCLNRFFIW